jgi:hypothetical protein
MEFEDLEEPKAPSPLQSPSPKVKQSTTSPLAQKLKTPFTKGNDKNLMVFLTPEVRESLAALEVKGKTDAIELRKLGVSPQDLGFESSQEMINFQSHCTFTPNTNS